MRYLTAPPPYTVCLQDLFDSPLKLTERMYLRSFLPPVISGHTPDWFGHRSFCMLCRACAIAYTASITNCTFPSCSYFESVPMRSCPGNRKKLSCFRWTRQSIRELWETESREWFLWRREFQLKTYFFYLSI